MTRYAVQRYFPKYEGDPLNATSFLWRTPRRPTYRGRDRYGTETGWCARLEDALTWVNRETAEKWAAREQERADWSDEHQYKSKVGDTVVTVVEVPDA